MAIAWPQFTEEPSNESRAIGSAIERMTSAALGQSRANQKHLQLARAAEAKRLRQESLDAARVLSTEYLRQE